MKKYVCDVCGYVYDPATGDEENGVKPGKFAVNVKFVQVQGQNAWDGVDNLDNFRRAHRLTERTRCEGERLLQGLIDRTFHLDADEGRVDEHFGLQVEGCFLKCTQAKLAQRIACRFDGGGQLIEG